MLSSFCMFLTFPKVGSPGGPNKETRSHSRHIVEIPEILLSLIGYFEKNGLNLEIFKIAPLL